MVVCRLNIGLVSGRCKSQGGVNQPHVSLDVLAVRDEAN